MINEHLSRAGRLLSSHHGSRFRRNFLKMVKANILAQALPFLAAPVLTRLYTPEDFGTLAVFTSMLGILLAVCTWRFDWSVPNTESRSEAAALMALSLGMLAGWCVVTFIFFYFWGLGWTSWKGVEAVEPFLLLLPVALIGGGLQPLLRSWYVRETDLTAVARSKIHQSMGGVVTSLAGGVARLGALGLIGSAVISAWVGIGTLVRHAAGLREHLAGLDGARLRAGAGKYWWEATISTATCLINNPTLTLVPLLFVQYYSPVEVGWYALIRRLAISPVTLFTTAIGQSFWAEAAHLAKTDRPALKRRYFHTLLRLFLIAIPISAVCGLGPFFVGPLLGREHWQGAGYVLAAIIPLMMGIIIFQPTNHLIVFGKMNLQLLANVIRLVLIVTAVVYSGTHGIDFYMAVFMVAVASLVGHLVVFAMHLKVNAAHG